MTTKVKIYLDMDGVLVDFEEGMVRKTTDNLRQVHDKLEDAADKLVARLPDDWAHFEKKNAGRIERDQLLNKFVKSLKGTPKEGTPEAKVFKKLYYLERDIKAKIYSTPGYYFDLKPMPDMMQLISFVRTLDPDPTILTAPIAGKPEAVEQCASEKREWVKKFIPDFRGQVICDSEKWKYASPEPNTVKILIDDRSKNTIPWQEAGGIAVLHTSAANTITQLKHIVVSKLQRTTEGLLETFVREVVTEALEAPPTTPTGSSNHVSYSAIILSKSSHNKLLEMFPTPQGWDKLAHHMTINMGALKGKARELIGQTFELRAVSFASDDKVMAVGVEQPGEVVSTNAIPHITIAVNRAAGGKPVMSNKLTNWKPLSEPVILDGTLQEVLQQ